MEPNFTHNLLNNNYGAYPPNPNDFQNAQNTNPTYHPNQNPQNHFRNSSSSPNSRSRSSAYIPNSHTSTSAYQNYHSHSSAHYNAFSKELKFTFIDQGNNSYKPQMTPNSFHAYNQQLTSLLQHQNNLFYPKPHWFWALENYKKKCLRYNFDLSFSIDEDDESFLAYQIINLFLQQNNSRKVQIEAVAGAITDPSTESGGDSKANDGDVSSAQNSAQPTAKNNILYVLETKEQLEIRLQKIRNTSSKKIVSTTDIDACGTDQCVLFTHARQYENPNFTQKLKLENFNLLIMETGSSLANRVLPSQFDNISEFKNFLLKSRKESISAKNLEKIPTCPVITLFKSVIDINLNQNECQQLTSAAEELKVDGSHTHLHTFFNSSINNVIEYSLNSGLTNPDDMKVTPQNEHIAFEPEEETTEIPKSPERKPPLLDEPPKEPLLNQVPTEPFQPKNLKFSKEKTISTEWKRYLPFCETTITYHLENFDPDSCQQNLCQKLSEMITSELDMVIF